MKKLLRRILITLTVLLVLLGGSWWVWREYWSGEMLWDAIQGRSSNQSANLIRLGARTDLMKYGRTVLHLAIETGQSKVASALIGSGIDLDLLDDSGRTALHLSVIEELPEIALLLLKSGASIDLTFVDVEPYAGGESGPVSAVDIAAGMKQMGLLNELLRRGAIPSSEALSNAVHVKERGMTRTLLDAGADPNGFDRIGLRPLQYARSDPGLARLLITSGADVNLRSEDGVPTLHFAGSKDVYRVLLEAGAEPNDQDRNGSTALHWWGGDSGIARCLLLFDADPDIKNKEGKTPLDIWPELAEIVAEVEREKIEAPDEAALDEVP